MKRLLFACCVFLFVSALAHGQGAPGYSNYSSASSGGGCIATASTLSSKCGTTAGTLASITDGSSSTDCVTGSGTNKNACIYNGSAWVFAGSSSTSWNACSTPTYGATTTINFAISQCAIITSKKRLTSGLSPR